MPVIAPVMSTPVRVSVNVTLPDSAPAKSRNVAVAVAPETGIVRGAGVGGAEGCDGAGVDCTAG